MPKDVTLKIATRNDINEKRQSQILSVEITKINLTQTSHSKIIYQKGSGKT